MKHFLLILALMILIIPPARAQDGQLGFPYAAEPQKPSVFGPLSDKPICFKIHNKAPYGVAGTLETASIMRADGIKTKHRSNFRLDKGERVEFCTTGPFYDGTRLNLVLRTLIPIFECKTAIDRDIYIYGRRLDEGGTKTWAQCY